MAKVKDKENLKSHGEKVTYKKVPLRLSADFSTETFQARRAWHEIVKVMKSKDIYPKLLYQVRLSFKIEEETRNFPEKKKLKKLLTPNPSCKKY